MTDRAVCAPLMPCRGPVWLTVLLSTVSVLAVSMLTTACGSAGSEAVLLATTTSVEDSGLLSHLIEAYRRGAPEATVRRLAVGSGEALELGRRGDADLLLVHDPGAEKAFVAEGYGEARIPIMGNDFVVAGPPADPASVASSGTAIEALRRIVHSGELFLSRADNSGTHNRELELWQAADILPEGEWYQESGQGMGPALQMASEQGAYLLTDRSTFYAMEPHLELAVLFEGDPQLRNVYSVIIVVGSRRESGARALQEWLTSPEGRRAIDDYRDAYGRPLFRALPPGNQGVDAEIDPTPGLRTRGGAGLLGGSGGRSSEAAGRAANGRATNGRATDDPGSSLRDRLLCRSVPPAHADARCG